MLKKTAIATALAAAALVPLSQAQAADYQIDIEGQHAFVQFKINHLGFSYILGSFETFDGQFHYDADDLDASSVSMEVQVNSLTTNHAERDRHILSADFLNASEFPTATFTSTGFEATGDNEGVVTGELMLHGGIAERIVVLANRLVGHVRGGLGMSNVLGCTLFGGVAGSPLGRELARSTGCALDRAGRVAVQPDLSK